MDDLLVRVLAALDEMLAIGNESFEAEAALFIRNRKLPKVRDANHVRRLRTATPEAIDLLLRRVEEEFSGFPHRRLDADPFTPPHLEARLALKGYPAHPWLAMVLEGPIRGSTREAEIRRVGNPTAWKEYQGLLRDDAKEWEARMGRSYQARMPEAILAARRIKEPAGARFWIAYVENQPAAYLWSWVASNGVGQVEDLFTHPDFRRRGLATALIHHGVADCRSRGAQEVFLLADPSDTPKHMYAAFGFRPLAVLREYWKASESAATL